MQPQAIQQKKGKVNPQISQMTQIGKGKFKKSAQLIDKRDGQTYDIIGAAMEVHKTLGCGFLETAYQEALVEEFLMRKIPFQREVGLPIEYKGKTLQTVYRADFVCFNSVVVELRALSELSGVEQAQVINYLKATGITRGILLNFGRASLQYERYILSSSKSASSARSADKISADLTSF
jgi:GxxExxY protein